MEYKNFEKLIFESFVRPSEMLCTIENKEINLDKGEEMFLKGIALSNLERFLEAEELIKSAICYLESEEKVIEAYIEMGKIKCRNNMMLDGIVWFYSALEKASLIENLALTSSVLINISYVISFYGMKKESIEILDSIDISGFKRRSSSEKYNLSLIIIATIYYKNRKPSLGENIEKDIEFKKFKDSFILKKYKNIMELYKALAYKDITLGEKSYRYLMENTNSPIEKVRYKYVYSKLLDGVKEESYIIGFIEEIVKDSIKYGNDFILLRCIEDIYKMGYIKNISKDICISVFLRESNRFNEEKQNLMNFTINNISEKLLLKKNLLNRKNKICKLSEEISELKVESVKDGLTGAFNRLYLDSFSADRLRKKFFTIAFMDLDNFKLVNDTRGHIFGDRVLVEMSSNLECLLRNKGSLIRFGGDEFIVFFEHNDIGEGLELIKYIHKNINGLSVSRYSKYDISVSTGSLTIEKNRVFEKSIYKYIEECDRLMYKVKGDSKNNFIHKYIC
ncbi:GGDEF domain-containing protein [Clostridium chrysemydis]|uniref:GGDEF domain-containing protein n=1 Tax=Clostridium chrysemydis TaxID=2665504 RepID=UPI0018832F8C|nr:GGDEF domain-containing protein [Clostridium chrysemydis]